MQTHIDALQAQLALQQNAPTPTADQLRVAAIRRAVITEAVERVAARRGIVATPAMMDAEYTRIVALLGGQDKVKDILDNKLHWSEAQYRDLIIRPSVLMNQLQADLEKEAPVQTDVKAKAQRILDQLKKGADFAKLAKANSEDASSAQGGDLGFFARGAMVKPFEDAAFSLKKGELYPELVQSQFGYHIIQVTDVKKDASGTVIQVRARHILLKTQTVDLLGNTLIAEIKSMRYWQFIHTDAGVKTGLDNSGSNG